MSLKSDINKFMKVELPLAHAKSVAAIEDYVYNFIVSTSPVDTGAYRANHNRTEGSPDYTFDETKTHGKQPSPVKANGFSTFFISNGAPYAEALETGHSQQGEHIFEVAYASAKAKFRL